MIVSAMILGPDRDDKRQAYELGLIDHGREDIFGATETFIEGTTGYLLSSSRSNHAIGLRQGRRHLRCYCGFSHGCRTLGSK